MSKRPIPSIPAGTDPAMARPLQAMKENLEVIMGQRGARIAELSPSASTTDLINKVNELIRLLQG